MSNMTLTFLPSGSELWVRTEPKSLQHSKYRVKIKHPQHSEAVFILKPEIKKIKGWNMQAKELSKVIDGLEKTKDILISHIDGEINSSSMVLKLQSMNLIID